MSLMYEIESFVDDIRARITAGRERRSNRALERRIDEVNRQREEENTQMTEQIDALQSQVQDQKFNAWLQEYRHNQEIQALHSQVEEQEKLQNEKLRAMANRHRSEMQALEERTEAAKEALQHEMINTRRELNEKIEANRKETNRMIAAERKERQQQMATMRAELEGQIERVDQKIETFMQRIEQKEDGDRMLAVYWKEQAERLLRQIHENFRASLIDPSQIQLLERKIRQAIGDIKGGQYQSAITAGREAYYGAMDMKEALTEAAMEWNSLFNEIKLREAQLLEDLDAAENRTYQIPLDGDVVEDTHGVDYWTNGQLSITRGHIRERLYESEKIRSLEEHTIEELRAEEDAIRSLQEELALVENASHINVAMSLSRMEMAEKIGAILDEKYEMVDADGDFFSTENREEYHAVFENPVTGDRMAVVITPIPDEAGIVSNHLELIIGNVGNDSMTRQLIANHVAETLGQAGIAACANRYGKDTYEEASRVGDIEAVAAGDPKTRAAKPLTAASASNDSTARIRRN